MAEVMGPILDWCVRVAFFLVKAALVYGVLRVLAKDPSDYRFLRAVAITGVLVLIHRYAAPYVGGMLPESELPLALGATAALLLVSGTVATRQLCRTGWGRAGLAVAVLVPVTMVLSHYLPQWAERHIADEGPDQETGVVVAGAAHDQVVSVPTVDAVLAVQAAKRVAAAEALDRVPLVRAGYRVGTSGPNEVGSEGRPRRQRQEQRRRNRDRARPPDRRPHLCPFPFFTANLVCHPGTGG